jgi:DNA-binding CsgD family transcriptional regulator
VVPAVATLRRAGAWARTGGLVPVATEAALAAGHRDFAEQLVADAQRGLLGRDAPAARAELDLARGLLLQDSAAEAAAEHFSRSCGSWQDIGRPYEAARAAERWAEVLAATKAEEAAERFTEALDTFTRLGATADTARCQQSRRRLGLAKPAARGRRGYGGRLSPREREVAELLARGASNHAIAQALFLSTRTVEKHVAHVLKKLGTTRRNVERVFRDVDGGTFSAGNQ